MDLRCFSFAANIEKEDEEGSPPVTGSDRKAVGIKDSGHLILNSVNKITSQVKKPTHKRSSSPINWFPRKKTESFLKRKIKLLQEHDGMNLSLVELLGNANPHYTRMAREKFAAQQAARKAMESRKAAMVEASWCKFLQAARIQSKDADSMLQKSKKYAAEAFEEAKSLGVMMFDKPDFPRRSCEVQSSSLDNGGKSTHSVTASFETAFQVEREVSAAVRKAFIKLANCYSHSNKDEFRDLLKKISQNPDVDELKDQNEFVEASTESSTCSSFEEIVNKMTDRLKELQEDELASLTTIVATCGLNAALQEMECNKDHYTYKCMRRTDITDLPSLDKFLVKHVTRLEREVEQARNSNNKDLWGESDGRSGILRQISSVSESTMDLGKIFIKRVSKFEREVQEAKSSSKIKAKKIEDKKNLKANAFMLEEENHAQKLSKKTNWNTMSRSERAVLETLKSFSCQNGDETNVLEQTSLDKVLVKPVHWTEREKMRNINETYGVVVKKRDQKLEKIDSLDTILVKHQPKLEKDKLAAVQEGSFIITKREKQADMIESLDDILIKHESKLEKIKSAATRNTENTIKSVNCRLKARENELQDAWGGLSLGNCLRPHFSKLEKDKDAWRRAERQEEIRSRECRG